MRCQKGELQGGRDPNLVLIRRKKLERKRDEDQDPDLALIRRKSLGGKRDEDQDPDQTDKDGEGRSIPDQGQDQEDILEEESQAHHLHQKHLRPQMKN